MQFCTVRSLFYHFGQEHEAKNSNDVELACPLLEVSHLLGDLSVHWSVLDHPQKLAKENEYPRNLYRSIVGKAAPDVFSGSLNKSSLEAEMKESRLKSNNFKLKKNVTGKTSSKMKLKKKLEAPSYSTKNSIVKSKVTGNNLKNNPFIASEEGSRSHVISYNTPLAATSTGVVAMVLGDHAIPDTATEPPSKTPIKTRKDIPSSSSKKSDVILKVPIPRLNKRSSPNAAMNSLHNKPKFVNILPKVSSPSSLNNQPVNLSIKDSNPSTSCELPSSANVTLRTSDAAQTFSSTGVVNNTKCMRVADGSSHHPLPLCAKSEAIQPKPSSSGLADDNIVMINPNLALRIVSTISQDRGSSSYNGCNTVTNTVNNKPIMSSIAPPNSNSLTIGPNSAKDTLTIVPQSSKEAASLKRNEAERKTPDILTIVPQMDCKNSNRAGQKSNSNPQIMTAAGEMSTSQAVNLILVNQSGNSQNGPTHPAMSPKDSSSSGLRSPPSKTTPNKTTMRNRSFTSDAEDLDSEDDRMFIDDQSDDASHDQSSVDPVSFCSVSIDDNNKPEVKLPSPQPSRVQNSRRLSSSSFISANRPTPLSTSSRPTTSPHTRSIPNLTPIDSSAITKVYRPIAPFSKPPPINVVHVNNNQAAFLQRGLPSLSSPVSSPSVLITNPQMTTKSRVTSLSAEALPIFQQALVSPSSPLILSHHVSPSSVSAAGNSNNSVSRVKLALSITASSPSPIKSVPPLHSSPPTALVAPSLPSTLLVPKVGSVVISAMRSDPVDLPPRSVPSPQTAPNDRPVYKKTVEMDAGKYYRRKYVCKTCGRRFGWSTDLKRHSILHTGEKPFRCDLCSHSFTRKFLMQNHRKRIHKVELDGTAKEVSTAASSATK